MKKPHYSFPILDDNDILLCLRELQMNVQETDLVNPTPQAVHSIYCHFLDILMNVTRDDLVQPQFTSTLEYPELHEDSIPMVTFLRSWYAALAKRAGLCLACLRGSARPARRLTGPRRRLCRCPVPLLLCNEE
jgi:kinetochore protein Nuf2